MDGIFALGGVVLGGVIVWFQQHLARIEAAKERRRGEVLELLSAFFADVDHVWSAAIRLETVVAITAPDAWGEQQENERQAAFAEAYMPRREAHLKIQRMRLIAPALVAPAREVLEASDRYELENRREHEARRDRASDALIAAATPFTKE